MATRKPRNVDGMGRPAGEPRDSDAYDRCSASWNGDSCSFPATIVVEGRRHCRLHYLCADARAIEAAIGASKDWASAISDGQDVPLTYKRHDGVEVPGFPSRRQVRARWDAYLLEKTPAYDGPGPRLGDALKGARHARATAVDREPGSDDE